MWGDEGFVVRFPEVENPPDPHCSCRIPTSRSRALVLRQLGSTSLFAARFRETAARALLLPRRRPGHAHAAVAAAQARRRSARRRVALRIVSGAARNLPRSAARSLRHAGARRRRCARSAAARCASRRSIRACRRRLRRRCSSATSPTTSTTATRRWPSGARRRCRSIRRSCASCWATPSCASCSMPTRSSPSSGSCSTSTSGTRSGRRTACTTCCCEIGDLTRDGDRGTQRGAGDVAATIRRARSATPGRLAVRSRAKRRYVAVEDVARYRDALGVPLPPGLPEALLEPVRDPAGDLALRYARSHGPFTAREFAARYGLGVGVARRCCCG